MITKQVRIASIYKLILSFSLILLNLLAANASVQPNTLFSNHMVLQQGVEVPVWGTAGEGEKITVEFGSQRVSTMTKNGRWMVKLAPLDYQKSPSNLIIKGNNQVVIEDVVVGEVWVCSGQSNMARRMSPHVKYQTITNFEQERDSANHPTIRQYTVQYAQTDTSVADANGNWMICSPSTVEQFSAVAYFFARDLQKALDVPIGIILSSVGGTQAKHWTSREAMESNPALLPLVQEYDLACLEYPQKKADYIAYLDSVNRKFRMDSLFAVNQKAEIPQKPKLQKSPQIPNEQRRIACYFNGMIAPLIPYAIKGVAWYQGESDNDFAEQYKLLFPTLISDWRVRWSQGDFPFLYVQVAPYYKTKPEIRDAQLLSLQSTKNTAMVVTTDCGNAKDIHPPLKQPVGYRLSLAARALAYKEKIEYSGPVYHDCKMENNEIRLYFEHASSGLVAKNGELKGFTIAAADLNFVQARAKIKDNYVIVSGDSITKPVALRYGWENVPDVNLYNGAGLPASPFQIINHK